MKNLFLNKQSLEFIVLMIVNKHPISGTGILKELESLKLNVPSGTLYPLLASLQKNNIIDQYAEETERSSAKLCYSLSEKGVNRLKELKTAWNELGRTIYKSGKNNS